jgi:hypothetical protein
MSTNVTNPVAFLRTSRNFPEDLQQLTVESNKSYVDIAAAVNDRIIGSFPTTRPAQTGEVYFIKSNQRQATFRQVYTFTSTTSISHGIDNVVPGQFISCFGSYTDGTNTYGLIFGSNGGTIPNQISFYVTSTQIVFEVNGGAPALTSGIIVLSWLANP